MSEPPNRVSLPDDLRTLTAFRFFAAFWVFLFHLRSRVEHEDTIFWDIIDNGARGVDFFFVLSGFVIFHVYEPQIAAGRFSFRDYIVKRFARIYPLHLTIFLVFLALAVIGNTPVNNALQTLLLLHSWGLTEGKVINPPSWTLSAEMFAYLLFGLLVVRRLPAWLLAMAFVGTACAVHLVALQLGKQEFIHLTGDFGSLRIVPLFILGMLLRRICTLISHCFAYFLGVLGLGLVVWISSFEPAGYEILLPFTLLILAGARVSDQRWIPTNGSVLNYLGEISYSIYLTHLLVIRIMLDYAPILGLPLLPWPLIGVAVLLASMLTYHCVEVPARRWINNRWANRRNSVSRV